jgi:hypothetical protein
MAWTDLASNQIPTFTDLQTSGFSLNSGQSAVTSNECVTKANALAKYNLSSAEMNDFESNQLVPKSSYVSGAVTSYSYSVKLDETSSSEVCDNPSTTVYSLSAEFTEGITLYFDSELTTIVDGYLYVSFLGTSEIFELNTSTGEVVFNTGFSC